MFVLLWILLRKVQPAVNTWKVYGGASCGHVRLLGISSSPIYLQRRCPLNHLRSGEAGERAKPWRAWQVAGHFSVWLSFRGRQARWAPGASR